MPPADFWTKANQSESSSLSVTSTPPIESLWPLRNLVVECTTTLAPRSSGCWKYGDMKVLSTATVALTVEASSATAAMSVTSIIGFVGDSMKTSLVFSWIASWTAWRSVVSTQVDCTR